MLTTLLGIPGLAATSPAFRAELWRLAERLGLDPSYIAAVMSHESGLNPSATNPNGGATGLIQFMPATAKAMGTSTQELRDMSAEEQLAWVERFFRPYRKTMRSFVPGDYLMATFMPAFIGKPADTVLFAKGTIGYTQNAGFDHAKKGTILISDVTADIDKIVAEARRAPSVEVDTSIPLEGAAHSPPPLPSVPQSQPSPSFSGPCELPVLRAGSRGQAVALWQRFLNKSAIVGTTVTVNGVFDDLTTEATRAYQAAKKLKPDCIVGSMTWSTVLWP